MTQDSDKKDEQWLSALAGQPDSGADSQLNQQASALRSALKAHGEALEATRFQLPMLRNTNS